MLSASIALPPDHRLVRCGPVDSYRWLGQAYAQVLQGFGLPAHALPPEEARQAQQQPARQALAWSCFSGLSPWEVVIGERKIVGLAQLRRRNGVLLVAGLLAQTPDWELLCRSMGRPRHEAAALAALATSCAAELGAMPSRDDLLSRLGASLEQALR
jgi:lipoate-protein ligase A